MSPVSRWRALRASTIFGGVATLFCLALIAYLFYAGNAAYFAFHRVGYDEGFFVWGGWSITKGLVPYRDFVEFKPPMVFVTQAIAQLLFGLRDHHFRQFFTLWPLAGTLSLFLALRSRRVSRPIAFTVVSALVYLFVHPVYHDSALDDSESIGLGYFIWGVSLFLLESRLRRVTDGVAAFFMCAAVLSKEPFGPEVGFTWLMIYLLRGGWSGSGTAGPAMFRSTVIGVATFFAILLLYMGPTGSLSAYLKMASGYARIYRDPMNSYCVVLGRFHPSTPLHDLHKQLDQARAEYLNPATLGFVTPLVVLAAVFLWRRSVLLFAAAVATLLAALWSVTASNCQWIHYYNMADGGLAAVLAVGAAAAANPLALATRSVRVWANLTVLAVGALNLEPRFEQISEVEHFPEADQEPVPGATALVAQTTVSTDRIFTTGSPYLFVMTDRLPAARFSTYDDEILGFYEGATDEEKLRPIYDELMRSRPALVFLDPEHPARKQRIMKALVMPFVNDNHYVKVNEYAYRRP